MTVSNYNFVNATYQYYPFTTNVTTTGNVAITNLYSAGTLNIDKPSGSANLTVSNVYSNASTFSTSVDGNINVTGWTFDVKGNSTFTTGGTMTVNNAGPTNSAPATNLTVNGNLTLQDLPNTTKGVINVNNGNLTIKSDIGAGKINNTMNITNGDMKLYDGANYKSLSINNGLVGNINITGGDLDISGLTMQTDNSSVIMTGTLNTHGGAIAVDGVGDILKAGVVTANSFTQSKNASTTINGDMNVTNSVSIQNGTLTISGSLSANSYSQNNATVITNVGNDMNISTSLDPIQGILNVGRDLKFGTDLKCNNNATVTVTRNVIQTTNSAGTLKLNSSDKLTIGGSFSSGTGRFSVDNNGALKALGDFSINSSGSNSSSVTNHGTIDITGKFSSGTGDFSYYSDNSVKVSGNFIINTDNTHSTNINNKSSLTISGNFTSGDGELTLLNENSSLSVGGSMLINDLSSSSDNKNGSSITVGGNLTIADKDDVSDLTKRPTFTNQGTITTYGSVTADHVILNSNGSGHLTYYKTLSEPNNGLITPKDAIHLPIQLTSFSAKSQTSSVTLSWTTASELNNKYFIVERSTDGSSFSEIAQVQGAGTSNLTHSYQSVDNGVAKGTYYYRLRQVDENGTESLSKVISETISSAAATKMQLLPSVVKSGEAITCAFDVPVAAIVDVIDIRGVVLACYTADANSSLQIKTDNLQAGMYFARLSETGEVRRFIVK